MLVHRYQLLNSSGTIAFPFEKESNARRAEFLMRSVCKPQSSHPDTPVMRFKSMTYSKWFWQWQDLTKYWLLVNCRTPYAQRQLFKAVEPLKLTSYAKSLDCLPITSNDECVIQFMKKNRKVHPNDDNFEFSAPAGLQPIPFVRSPYHASQP